VLFFPVTRVLLSSLAQRAPQVRQNNMTALVVAGDGGVGLRLGIVHRNVSRDEAVTTNTTLGGSYDHALGLPSVVEITYRDPEANSTTVQTSARSPST
jgi:hypothetical protein